MYYMNIVWDEMKNKSNIKKHGVSFETASYIFEDPLHISVPDRIVDGEERWLTMGLVGGMVVLVVAHTYDDEIIRIVSARKATKYERKKYEEKSH